MTPLVFTDLYSDDSEIVIKEQITRVQKAIKTNIIYKEEFKKSWFGLYRKRVTYDISYLEGAAIFTSGERPTYVKESVDNILTLLKKKK